MHEIKEKNFVSVVVYVHNAEKTLEHFLNALNPFLEKNFENYEIICVNDASTDDRWMEIVKKYAKNSGAGMVTVLNMSCFQGLELAMNAGVDLAIGDFIYEFDTTFISWPQELLRDIYDRCLQGYDIVSACPKKSGLHGSDLFYWLYNRASASGNKIQTETFRILSRRAINRVQSMSRLLPYRKAVYAGCGLQTDAVFYEMTDMIPAVRSEVRCRQRETAADALILYTDLAYKCSLMFSAVMILLTLSAAAYTFVVYFTKTPVRGWVTTMLLLTFGFFGISCLLTVLIKYASLILRTVFSNKRYVVESIEKLK